MTAGWTAAIVFLPMKSLGVFLAIAFGSMTSALAEELDLRATGSMATARTGHSATVLTDGRVLVAGGGSGVPSNSAELYEPATGAWSDTGRLALPRVQHTASLLPGGKVLVAGGFSVFPDARTEIYDPAAGTWSAGASLAEARHGHTATTLPDGKVLVVGGQGANYGGLASAELYDPAAGTWTPTVPLATGRYFHSATLLNDGRVLVVGGVRSTELNGTLASAEIYNPATGAWSGAGAMGGPRQFHRVTLLLSGKVLAAGGYDGNGPIVRAELFDPATGAWSATGNLLTARHSQAAALLPNGRVIAFGGLGRNGTLATAELYDPTTGRWSVADGTLGPRSNASVSLLSGDRFLIAGGINGSFGGPVVGSAEVLYASVAPESRLINVSTRLRTDAGDNVLIGGFVLVGGPKRVVVRALGPSLAAGASVPGTLANPQLALFDSSGAAVASNDTWGDDPAAAELRALGLAPADASESACVVTLGEGAYTAVVRGASGGSGNCLVEVYDASIAAAPRLVNLSTRGPVGTGDNVMIAGFVVQGGRTRRVLVRALGPSLAGAGVPNVLADPMLELRSGANLLASNDNWQSTQGADISSTGLAPSQPAESALLVILPPGTYTATVRGRNGGTGNGLVEVYELP